MNTTIPKIDLNKYCVEKKIEISRKITDSIWGNFLYNFTNPLIRSAILATNLADAVYEQYIKNNKPEELESLIKSAVSKLDSYIIELQKFIILTSNGNAEMLVNSGLPSEFLPADVIYSYLAKQDDSKILIAKTVLVVDDNSMNRLIAHTMLKNYEMKIFEAENGKIAYDFLLKNKNIDIVLMDIQMPIMNGLEATKLIRENIDINIPIIAFTANPYKGVSEIYKAVGMNDYLPKPFDEKSLVEIIKKNLKK